MMTELEFAETLDKVRDNRDIDAGLDLYLQYENLVKENKILKEEIKRLEQIAFNKP